MTARRGTRWARLAVAATLLAAGGTVWADDAPDAPASLAAGQGVTKEQAQQVALEAVPGKVTDVSVERKRGQDLYVVEIVAAKDGAETDVLVDPKTGKVLGTE